MQHQISRLFEKTARAAFLRATAISKLLLLMVTAFLVQAQAQPAASSNIHSNQKSETSGIVLPNNSSGATLGVYLGDINEERAKDLKLAEARGAVVGNVEPGSPAAKVGLQENDVILAFNSQPINNPAQFYRLLTQVSAGATVTLGISRSGTSQNVRVVLGQRPATQRSQNNNVYATAEAYLQSANERAKEADEARRRGDAKEAVRLESEAQDFRRLSDEARASVDRDLSEGRMVNSPSSLRLNTNVTAARYQLGVRVTPLNEQLAAFFKVKEGVLVSEVRVGGVAESAGIKAGDCIVAVNGEQVTSLTDLNRLVDRASEKGASESSLSIVRDRAELTVQVKFGQK